MYTRGSIVTRVSCQGRNGCLTNGGAFCWNAHSNYSSISDPPALNNTVGFCIDAGDEQISFNKRNRCQSGYLVNYASAKGLDLYMFSAK
jgi:hypothetical protein